MAHDVPIYVPVTAVAEVVEITGVDMEGELTYDGKNGDLIGAFLIPNHILSSPSVIQEFEDRGIDYEFAYEGGV